MGTASGLSVLVLSACTPPEPEPVPTTAGPVPQPTPSATVPRPSAILRSNWQGDPFARGSYSYLPVGAAPEHREALAESLDGKLYFAGEATSVRNPSTVHGALASGYEVAAEIAAGAPRDERIAVIGAGVAGAAAASRLREYGFEVLVIEARDRTGGRIHSVAQEGSVVAIELGAGAVREQTESLAVRLSELGVDVAPAGAAPLLRTAGGALVKQSDVGATVADAALSWAAEQQVDVSLAEAFTGSGHPLPEEVQAGGTAAVADAAPTEDDLVAAQLTSTAGARLGAGAADLSAWYGLGEVPSGEERIVLGAFSTLVDDLLDGVEVTLSSPVASISYGGDQVSIRLATGESIGADRVVLSVPLGVLKSGGVEFDPALPFAKRAAIGEIAVGLGEKIWLSFDEPFWETDAVLWQQIGGDSGIRQWVNLDVVGGGAALMGMLGPDAAAAMADLSDDEVTELAMEALAAFLPQDSPVMGPPTPGAFVSESPSADVGS